MIRPLLALAAIASIAVAEEPKSLKPTREWVEVVRGNELSKKAPASGVITDAKAFAALWKAWRTDEKVPEIDFKKNIAVVTLSLGGPNKPNLRASLDARGDLKTIAFSTKIGGDAFGYSIAIFPREGIKTLNGKAIKE